MIQKDMFELSICFEINISSISFKKKYAHHEHDVQIYTPAHNNSGYHYSAVHRQTAITAQFQVNCLPLTLELL